MSLFIYYVEVEPVKLNCEQIVATCRVGSLVYTPDSDCNVRLFQGVQTQMQNAPNFQFHFSIPTVYVSYVCSEIVDGHSCSTF